MSGEILFLCERQADDAERRLAQQRVATGWTGPVQLGPDGQAGYLERAMVDGAMRTVWHPIEGRANAQGRGEADHGR